MRLNTLQKVEILAKLNDGVNGNRLAKEYGVVKSTISLLKKRKYNEMLHPDKRSGTFNPPSSMNEGENESNQSKNVSTSNEDETSDEANDERVEKKSRTLPMFRQLKLYKQPFDIDDNQHIDEDVASNYDDDEEEEDESEEEEDLDEICRKLHHVYSNLHIPAQSLCVMFKLFSKLRSSGCIE